MKRLLPALALSLAPLARATLIVDDSFADGGFTNGPDALDTDWGRSSGTLSVVDDTAGLGSGNALNYDAISSFQHVFGSLGSTITLGVGDSLALSFRGRYTQVPANVGGAFRFGFYDSAVNGGDSGYGSQVFGGTGTPIAVNIVHDREIAGADNTPLAGSDTLVLGSGGTAVAATDVPFSASFTMVRTAGGMQLTSVFNAGTFTTVETTSAFTTFDRLVIRNGNTASDFRVDNVQVDHVVVPEPAAGVLFGLGALLLRRFRSRA